jgi:DNA-binding NarL/FixJ family response regulator
VIQVALADDQELVRAGFAALLDAEDDIDVVAEAADGQQAVRVAARHAPDVLLMDIRMPGWMASRRPGASRPARISATSTWSS